MVVNRRWSMVSLGAGVAVIAAVSAFGISAASESVPTTGSDAVAEPDAAGDSDATAQESAAQQSGALLGLYFDELSVLPGFESSRRGRQHPLPSHVLPE